MKKYLSIVIFLIYLCVSAQDRSNPFFHAEKTDDISNASAVESSAETARSGNPPGDEDLPIDDYIPALLILGLGMIVYNTYRKKTLIK